MLDSDGRPYAVLRMELQGLKGGAIRYLTEHQGIVQQAIEQALAAFNWDDEIRSAINGELPHLLRRAIRDEITAAMYEEGFATRLRGLALAALAESLTEAVQKQDRKPGGPPPGS